MFVTTKGAASNNYIYWLVRIWRTCTT